MNKEKVAELVLKYHNPDQWKTNSPVYQVWEDGEITSQEARDLSGPRTLRFIESGRPDARFDGMPCKEGVHSYMFAPSKEAAYEVRKALVDEGLPKNVALVFHCEDATKLAKLMKSVMDQVEAMKALHIGILGDVNVYLDDKYSN